jgi:membrane fusion protein, multidrug efflux system
MQMEKASRGTTADVVRRVVICALVLLVGAAIMLILVFTKRAPAEVAYAERPLRVEVTEVRPRDVPVTMTGYGSARPLDVVPIAPEVTGKVVAMHSNLQVGGIVPANELLFAIDPSDYQTALLEARAAVGQLQNNLLALEKQVRFDSARLETLERNRSLSGAEYQRVRNLFEVNRVGTQAGVEAAERAFNTISDQADQLVQAVALYPLRIAETRNALQASEARLAMAQNNLDRCQVRVPFDGRVTQYSIKVGQFVNRGATALTLANDSLLEIQIPLDSRDARQWLQFRSIGPPLDNTWFGALEPVRATIRWTEDVGGYVWEGILHRVVRFSEDTRTLTVAVRIDAGQAMPVQGNGLPLVDGMFCRVDIPGKVIPQAIALPRWAVSFDNTVHMAVEGRLKTVPVQVARIEGETAYVASGLNPGDQVIRTRLVDPLENSLLDIVESPDEEQAS